MSQSLPPKKDVALALLERSTVRVHLDPRAEGVVVPPDLRKQVSLVLQIGLNMAVPIPDLRLDDDGMSCTLSFGRVPFHCVVPWGCVFAMVGDDQRGMVWPDDVPPEVQRAVQAPQPTGPKSVPSPELRERERDREEPSKRPRRAIPPPEPDARKRVREAGKKEAKKKKGEGGKDRPALFAVGSRPPSEGKTKRAGAESERSSPSTPRRVPSAPTQIEAKPAAAEASSPPAREPVPQPVPAVAKKEPPSQPRTPREPGASEREREREPDEAKPKRALPPYLRVVK